MELLEIIISRITTYFPDLKNSEVVVKEIVFEERSTYPIHRFDIYLVGNPKVVVASLVVKFAPVFEENIEGKTEFENMCLVKSKIGDEPNLGCINPLDYINEIDALVTEFVPHKRLSEVMLDTCTYLTSSVKYNNLRKNTCWSGAWLSSFHNYTFNNTAVIGETDYFDRCESIIRYLNDVQALGNTMEKVSDVLSKMKNNIASIKVPMSRVHGDFGPQNIGIGGDNKIYVFDLQRKYNESIYYDITYFLVTLETLNPYPKHKYFSRAKSVALSEEFLVGYRSKLTNSIRWNNAGYHVYYLRNLLQRAQKQYINQKLDKSSNTLSHVKKILLRNNFIPKINRELKILAKL